MFLSALFGSQHKDVCLCAQRRRHAMKKISDKTSSSANFLNVLFGDLVHSLQLFFQSYNLQLFLELLAFAPGKCWFVPSLSVLLLSPDLSLIFFPKIRCSSILSSPLDHTTASVVITCSPEGSYF